jgi:hypothetical protein
MRTSESAELKNSRNFYRDFNESEYSMRSPEAQRGHCATARFYQSDCWLNRCMAAAAGGKRGDMDDEIPF